MTLNWRHEWYSSMELSCTAQGNSVDDLHELLLADGVVGIDVKSDHSIQKISASCPLLLRSEQNCILHCCRRAPQGRRWRRRLRRCLWSCGPGCTCSWNACCGNWSCISWVSLHLVGCSTVRTCPDPLVPIGSSPRHVMVLTRQRVGLSHAHILRRL